MLEVFPFFCNLSGFWQIMISKLMFSTRMEEPPRVKKLTYGQHTRQTLVPYTTTIQLQENQHMISLPALRGR